VPREKSEGKFGLFPTRCKQWTLAGGGDGFFSHRMPGSSHRFLIVDDNSDSRFLLAKTLLRKFPGAQMLECQTSERAVAILSRDKPHAVVAHRSQETDGQTLIRMLRAVDATVPIVMVSGIDRREAARVAGANAFLHYDEWLRIGTVVAELLRTAAASPDAESVDRQ
jgi:CheY-like chemotaxis protein